jgi:hypothetical protein
MSMRALPEVEPTVSQGDAVRAELIPDGARSRDGSPAWQALATLTKSNVDAYLFTQFHYPQPLDLSNAVGIAIETWAPDGQSTAGLLLVILHEEGGGDFIAETSRSLATPGREKTFIPLCRFQLASWSNDNDGILDLKRVGDIRIGWGGYIGVENEKIQFSVARPQIITMTRNVK